MTDERQKVKQLNQEKRIARQIRKKTMGEKVDQVLKKAKDQLLKKAKNKIIWELFSGLTNPLSFIPTLLALDAYAFGSYLVNFFSEELSKKMPRLNMWQLAILAGANLLFFIILLIFIVFIVFTICIVSVGTECPLSWWEIIKNAWDIVF